jgi:hypothetical protein
LLVEQRPSRLRLALGVNDGWRRTKVWVAGAVARGCKVSIAFDRRTRRLCGDYLAEKALPNLSIAKILC